MNRIFSPLSTRNILDVSVKAERLWLWKRHSADWWKLRRRPPRRPANQERGEQPQNADVRADKTDIGKIRKRRPAATDLRKAYRQYIEWKSCEATDAKRITEIDLTRVAAHVYQPLLWKEDWRNHCAKVGRTRNRLKDDKSGLYSCRGRARTEIRWFTEPKLLKYSRTFHAHTLYDIKTSLNLHLLYLPKNP